MVLLERMQSAIAETNQQLYERALNSFVNNELWESLYNELTSLSKNKEDRKLMNIIGEDDINELVDLSPTISYLQLFVSSYKAILSLNGGDVLQIIYWYTNRPNELNDKMVLFSSIWSYETAAMVYRHYRNDKHYKEFVKEECSTASLLSLLFMDRNNVAERLMECIEMGHGHQVEKLIRKVPETLDTYISISEDLGSIYLLSLEYNLKDVQDAIFPFVDMDFIIKRLIEEERWQIISYLMEEDPPLPRTWMEYFRLAVDNTNDELLTILANHIPSSHGELIRLVENDLIYQPVLLERFPFLSEP